MIRRLLAKPRQAVAPHVLFILAAVVVAVTLIVYPIAFIFQAALNTGDPDARPVTSYGMDRFGEAFLHLGWLGNTLLVATSATILAVLIGLVLAWIIHRTDVPGARILNALILVPFYVTPLVGALAWATLASPKAGLVNQIWRSSFGASGTLINISSPLGIAWVMAIYEGTVAYSIISGAIKSLDPSLEESARVLGAGMFRTAWRVTVPLLRAAILGSAAFVFAEMIGSFAVALILGQPAHFNVVTTAIYQLLAGYPPDYPLAAALGLLLCVFTILSMWIYSRNVHGKSFVTLTGKAFRGRRIATGRWRPLLLGLCAVYALAATILPLGALLFASFLKFNTTTLADASWTLANYQSVFTKGATRAALINSLILAVSTATIGVGFMSTIAWYIYRTDWPGRRAVEYIVMWPQAIPRMTLALGLLWAWISFPVGIYGTRWLLLIAYLTVFMPLGIRSIAAIMLQLDRSLEDCARVSGASWWQTVHRITLPLLRPGLMATWALLFIVSIREVGASILLVSARTKVVGPAIVESWESSGTQATAAISIVQSLIIMTVLVAVQLIASRSGRDSRV